MNEPRRALVLGNSDGIGRVLVRRLSDDGWVVTGLSRSPSPELAAPAHVVCDVLDPELGARLSELARERGPFDLVVWCVGIGEELDLGDLASERRVIDTNFSAAVTALGALLPRMISRGRGHVVALSSLADLATIPDAPSYAASKAGLSTWLRSLALACRPHGVAVTNVRFGFVDTKMAQARRKPLMISAERAAEVVLSTLERRPMRVSRPRLAALAMHAAAALLAIRFLVAP